MANYTSKETGWSVQRFGSQNWILMKLQALLLLLPDFEANYDEKFRTMSGG